MKKVLKTLVVAILAIVIIAVVAAACVWNREIATISSIRQVDQQGYLYSMEYKADYDLDEVINADIDNNKALLQYVVSKLAKGLPVKMNKEKVGGEFACTSFQAKNMEGDGFLYGRNYDFFKNPTMVTVSHPKKGYASISVSDLAHVGYNLESLPTSFVKKALCLASIYAPMDGINEKGLCTSIMALPRQAARQNTSKHDVGTSIIMRLFLDKCATVDEALALVDSLDICHDQEAGSGYHYMVADASGDCAVIEFDKNDGWKTMVVRKAEGSNWMHVTNHLLSPKYYTTEPNPEVGNPHSRSWWRYEKVAEFMAAHDGILTAEQALECLSLVHWKDLVWENGIVEDTQYSALYDQSAITLSLRPWNDYETTYRFDL